jgi:hypothetical protein
MRDKQRPKLPRGLRWKPDSAYIWFSWRDERGRQHQQSTNTADSDEAMVYKWSRGIRACSCRRDTACSAIRKSAPATSPTPAYRQPSPATCGSRLEDTSSPAMRISRPAYPHRGLDKPNGHRGVSPLGSPLTPPDQGRWLSRIDEPEAIPREMSSRSAKVSARTERRRAAGAIPPLGNNTQRMQLCGLPQARPISCNDSPAFHRLQTSALCAADSLDCFPSLINTILQ